MQPVGDDDRVVALAQLLERDVAADLDVVVELHAVLGDPVDVELDDVARAAGRPGTPMRVVPPPDGKRLVDVDLVAPAAELLGGGQAGRPGADHGHAATGRRGDDDVVGHVVAVVPVDQEALHGADGERLVDVGAAAGLLAGRRADVAADGRDRVRVAGEDVALLEAALGGQHQVAPAVRVDRAAFLALDIALKPVDADLGGLEPQWNRGIADHGVVVALPGGVRPMGLIKERQDRCYPFAPIRLQGERAAIGLSSRSASPSPGARAVPRRSRRCRAGCWAGRWRR